MTTYNIYVSGTAYTGGCRLIPYRVLYGTTTNPADVTSQSQTINICASGTFLFRVFDGTRNLGNDGGTAWATAKIEIDGWVPPEAHDCINGTCVKKTLYSTPGIYKSLEECKLSCGGNNTCNGKCISNSDWAQIENLATQIRAKNCD